MADDEQAISGIEDPLNRLNDASGVEENSTKDTIDGRRDTRRIIKSAMFSPVTTADDVNLVQTLQTLTVTRSNNVMSNVDHTRRRDVVTPPVGIAGTPELSPSLITSLRGSSSPSYSQISLGSIGPSLTSAALQHKYDLTPVTRNTSDVYCDVITKSDLITVTPSSGEGYLHGENLAFPSDLSSSTPGPAMPPLQPVQHRSSLKVEPILRSRLLHQHIEIQEPVQFPSRKFYSFTTRKQYEEALLQDPDSDDDLCTASDSDDEVAGLTPYAPHSRPANFDIESLPEEELKRIFITREARLAEIPLEQRVPSLHMANHLHGSTASISYTDHEDEDSVLNLRDDDASLSSRGSSLYFQDEEVDNEEDAIIIAALQRKQRKRKQRKKEQKAVEWLQSVEADQNVLAEAASSKFLTGSQPRTQAFRRQSSPAVSLQRQTSSPSTLLGVAWSPPS